VEWLRFAALERYYGARKIFGGIDGVVRDDAKIGLVGPNGAGKSSLVRILAGLEQADGGTLTRARGARIGYLSQGAASDTADSLRALMQRAFERRHAEEARVRELEADIAAAAAGHDRDREERLLRLYGEARETFDRHAGAGDERRLRAMLATFGFVEADLDRPASAFSGGQRTRAALARVLLEEPDYFILDEPTNHLDVEIVRRLEEFLIEERRAALVVSHDRYFLDRIATEIWDLDGGALEQYEVPQGSAYSAYVVEKAARAAQAQRDYERALGEERRRKAVIAELRTHGSHNYAQVRSREKQLAKRAPAQAPKTSQQRISVRLDAARRATSGLALAAKGLGVAYAAPLFERFDLDLARGERLAIVGPNGAGKSTLLGVLAGRRAPDRGTVRTMDGVRTAYFSQDAGDDLPPGLSATEAVLEGAAIDVQTARDLLGRLGLGGDAGDKPVEAFSGGERRRIMLARLMARSADVLFLDEPTNDLDIASREALESVLASYGGALVVVSHDRYLLRRLAERVVALGDGRATVFAGDYERYEASERNGADAPARGAGTKGPDPERIPQTGRARAHLADAEREARLARERNLRDLAECEREVARLDDERARLEREFADPALYDDRARVALLERQLGDARDAVDTAFARWEALSEAANGTQ
jgi:ATP-binding cassette subfamily F protein 3